MCVEVLFIFSSAERQWKAARQAQLVLMDKEVSQWETWIPYLLSCLNVSDCTQQEVGPVEHNRTVGVTAVIEQRHTGEKEKKKRRILWLSRQNQTSKFNNYNGKRHFNLGAGGQVGLTVYQGLSPLRALAYFPWSERLPGWKLIREIC